MKKNEYFTRLDIIRIVLCILVLLYHLNIIKGGFLAVCTFLALSGYLSCISALRDGDFSIKSYYKNRLKKLYLPLIIVVAITVITIKLIPSIKWINLKQETTSVVFGYNNFWQLNANMDYFTRNVNSPFIHFWYISILMQVELIFPIVFVFIKKLSKTINNNILTLTVIILTVISTIVFYSMSRTQDMMQVYYNTFARSFSILFGILMAVVQFNFTIKIPKIFKKYNRLVFIIYLLILVLLCIFVSNETRNYGIFMILTTLISIKLIGYSTIETDRIDIIEEILSFLAKISYEAYLVQYPIIFITKSINISSDLRNIIVIGLTFIIALIIHLLLNITIKHKNLERIRKAVLVVIIAVASCIVITEKDYTSDMAELKNVLKQNTKIMEEKNKEFKNTEDIEKSTKEKQQETKKSSVKIVNENEENNKKLSIIEEKNIAEKVRNLPVVGIGDSIFLDAIGDLYKKFPKGYFDGKISRSLKGGREVIIDLKKKGKLSNNIILALATNGDYSDKKNKEFMDIIGNREVFWINAVGADDPQFNEKFKNFAKAYPNIHIVDWEAAAKNHPEYFYSDGIHAKGNGLKVYINAIYETVYDFYLEKYKNGK